MASDIDILSYIRSRQGRLAMTYFAIIAALTLLFSIILFSVVSVRLTRPLDPPRPAGSYRFERDSNETVLKERIEAAQADLLITMVLFNILIDAIGMIVSYYLARATMKPIEESVEAQARFVSDASHELRTPLTALQTANEVALRDKKMKLSEAKEVIAYNIEEVVKLRELTNALLSLAGDSRSLTRESFDIQDALTEAMQPIILLAQKKDITIDEKVGKNMVHGNMMASAQIIRILLENAVKYSPASTTIHVDSQVQKSHVILSVRDEGEGIDAEAQSHIFDRFFRADASRSSHENAGFGLGLSIAKDLSEKQGVKLRLLKSSPGNGTTFCIEFPKK